MPENTLSEKYQISRVSVRKALAQLVEEGLIEKIAGKGNRVKPPVEETVRQTIAMAWFSQSYEHDILHKWISSYEQTHPYVKVELIILPAEEYAPRLAAMIEQGTGPDLFFLADSHFRHFSEKGKLGLLSPYKPAKLDPERDSYPKLFEMFTCGGELMSVPVHFSPVVICYNKALFEKAGVYGENPVRNWDELLEVAKRCTADLNGDGMIDQYGFCFSSAINRWPVFLLQNGGAFKSEDGSRSVFADERNVEALQFCADLMYKHQVSPIYSHSSSYLAESMFKKQRCAMILSTYYFMNEFRGNDIPASRWDVLPIPENRSKGTLVLAGSLGINKYSDKIKVAQSLIDFMTGTEAQTLLKQNGCTIPVLRSVAEDNSLLDPNIHPAHYNYFAEAMANSYSLFDLQLTSEDIAILYDELQMLWANMETAEVVCRRVEERMNKLIAEKSARA